jgi:hypothetical protein
VRDLSNDGHRNHHVLGKQLRRGDVHVWVPTERQRMLGVHMPDESTCVRLGMRHMPNDRRGEHDL